MVKARPLEPGSSWVDDGRQRKVFQHTRALLAVTPATKGKRLPQRLTDRQLVAFYEAVWQARHPTYVVMIKMPILTGLRNTELARIRLWNVDLDQCHIRAVQRSD